MGECIAVLSGKGGTGKTSLCAGLATALAQEGRKVLCIDCDVGLRNLDISLGMTQLEALSFLDVCRGDYPLARAAVHPDFPSLSFLTAPVNCRAEDISREAFAGLVHQGKRAYDYVLLDAPAGTEGGFRLAAENADRCILVTGSDPASVRDAGRTGQILELMGITHVRLIVNRVKEKMVSAMKLTIDDVMDRSGLPLLGLVPEDMNVTFAAAFGKPLLLHSKKGPASAAIRRIAKRLQGMHVPIR